MCVSYLIGIAVAGVVSRFLASPALAGVIKEL
jgi:FtsH-binding integral membrane protein